MGVLKVSHNLKREVVDEDTDGFRQWETGVRKVTTHNQENRNHVQPLTRAIMSEAKQHMDDEPSSTTTAPSRSAPKKSPRSSERQRSSSMSSQDPPSDRREHKNRVMKDWLRGIPYLKAWSKH